METAEILSKFVLGYMPYKTREEREEVIVNLVEFFSDTPEDLLQTACENLTKTERFLPAPAVIREAIGKAAEQSVKMILWPDLILDQHNLFVAAHHGEFDPAAWVALAARMERAGMIYSAARLRERAGYLVDVTTWAVEAVK